MNYETYIGIDIGRYGAICIKRPEKITVFEMPSKKKGLVFIPDGKKIHQILSLCEGEKVFATVEEQHSRKGQDAKSTFTAARYYESVLTAIDIRGYKYKTVDPKKWKNKYNLDSMKIKSIIKVAYMFPEAYNEYIKQGKSGNFESSEDGKCEAILLADYGENVINSV